MNKKLLFGLGTAALSFAGVWWLKQNLPLAPKVPVVDENTVLLFQLKYSPYCVKVAKIMDYKGIPYKIVELMPFVSKKFVRELSGQGLVPVIKHRGKVIFDSTIIAKYLEELKPEPSIFINDDKALNQEVLLMEDWADESFEPPFGTLAKLYLFEHPEVIVEDSQYSTGIDIIDNNKDKIVPIITRAKLKDYGVDPGKKDLLKKRVRGYLDLLSGRLEKSDFLVGDRLTLADIAVASHLTVAEKVPYIYEDDDYAHIFAWQKDIFNATKRRLASSNI
jgi:glutathione S-transferase